MTVKIANMIDQLSGYLQHHGNLDVAWFGNYAGETAQFEIDLDVAPRDKDEEDPSDYPPVLVIQATSPALRESNDGDW